MVEPRSTMIYRNLWAAIKISFPSDTCWMHVAYSGFRATEELESLSSAYWIGAAFAVVIDNMMSRIADVND